MVLKCLCYNCFCFTSGVLKKNMPINMHKLRMYGPPPYCVGCFVFQNSAMKITVTVFLSQILKFNSVTQCLNSISHRSEGHKFVTKIYIYENFENDFYGHLSCNLKFHNGNCILIVIYLCSHYYHVH